MSAETVFPTQLFARSGSEALRFAEAFGKDVLASLAACERGDWLLVALAELGLPPERLTPLLALAVDELVAQTSDPTLEAAASLAKRCAKGRATGAECGARADELELETPEDTGVPRSAALAVIELLRAAQGESLVYSALEIGEQYALYAFYVSCLPGNGEQAFDVQKRELKRLAEKVKEAFPAPEQRAALRPGGK